MGKKNERLNKLLKEYEKNYAIQKASDIKQTEVIPTGVFTLDYCLSGGIKVCQGGNFIEFFGAESSGKSTFALHVVKQFQKENKICVWIDAENSYDKTWAKKIGVDNENLLILKPEDLEQAGDLFVKLIPETDLIVVDSIINLIPQGEAERDTSEVQMALQARVNSLICRKINKAIAHQTTTIIFINQLREKVGQLYGNPYTTAGGRALKHLYHTRIEFKSGKPMDIGSGDKKERIGVEINIKAVKNKKGIPHRKGVIDFYFDSTIDNKKSIFFAGVKFNVIEFSGKTYQFGDKKAVGKDNFMELLDEKDLKEIGKEIWKRIK